jgi:hypothetical protein
MKIRNVLIILGVVVILILGGLFYLYWQNSQLEPEIVKLEDSIPDEVVKADNEIVNSKTITKEAPVLNSEEIEKQAALNQATIFAEIISSYSNHDNYQSLLKLNSIVSPALQGQINSLISAKQVEHGISDDYVGLEGRVIAKSLTDFDLENGTTIVNLKIQQQKEIGNELKIIYIDAKVGLLKNDNKWQIDSFDAFDKI